MARDLIAMVDTTLTAARTRATMARAKFTSMPTASDPGNTASRKPSAATNTGNCREMHLLRVKPTRNEVLPQDLGRSRQHQQTILHVLWLQTARDQRVPQNSVRSLIADLIPLTVHYKTP